jgi:peptidyl-prolyl cis-trans isomerase D
MRVLRKHRDWLMIVIAILAIPFVFYFVQKPDYGAMARSQVGKIYGHNISVDEARREMRLFELARVLDLNDFLRDLAPNGSTAEQIQEGFALNLMVLRHEADALGIEPTRAEIVATVTNFPVFRGATGFDPAKYDEFVGRFLSPNGFSSGALEELAKDELRLTRIKQLVSAGVTTPESEGKSTFEEFYGKNFVSVIRLHASDYLKEIKITDDDIQKYFDAHKAELKTDEKRKVEFVKLALTDEQKKLTGKERIDVLQKLADRANDFSQAMLEKDADFHKVAAKFQLPVQTTGEFTTGNVDPLLNADPQLSAVAFQLNPQEPNSDPVQAPDGFYVLHLAGVNEARPLTLEEAKPKIVDAIKASRAREWATNKGAKAAHDVAEGLKAGEPLTFALEKFNLKPEKLEPFTLADDVDPAQNKPKNQPQDIMIIKNMASQIEPGTVSEFFPNGDGGLFVYLEKREPPDPGSYQQKRAAFDERYLNNKRALVFLEWLHDRYRAANVEIARGSM